MSYDQHTHMKKVTQTGQCHATYRYL